MQESKPIAPEGHGRRKSEEISVWVSGVVKNFEGEDQIALDPSEVQAK